MRLLVLAAVLLCGCTSTNPPLPPIDLSIDANGTVGTGPGGGGRGDGSVRDAAVDGGARDLQAGDLSHRSIGAGPFAGVYLSCQLTITTTLSGVVSSTSTSGQVQVSDDSVRDLRIDFMGSVFGPACVLAGDRDPNQPDAHATVLAGQVCSDGPRTFTTTSGDASHNASNTLTLHVVTIVGGDATGTADTTATCQ